MSNQVIAQPHELVHQQEWAFAGAIEGNSVQWNKESQFAIQALQSNSYTATVARNNVASLQNAIINIAAIGISLNPALKHAYLVPRKVNKAQAVCLDISYMGLIHLAVDSGSILWAQCKIVHQNDKFTLNGVAQEPTHKHNPFGDRGEIVGAYCVAKTKDGDFLTETMPIKDIYDIRNRSEAYKKGHGPWKTDEGEMIRKTVVKRAYKYWPKCERLAKAIDELNHSGEGFTEINEDTYVQERKEALDSLAVEAAEACLQADDCQSLDELKGVLFPIAQKAKRAEAQGVLNQINSSKKRNTQRINEALNNETV